MFEIASIILVDLCKFISIMVPVVFVFNIVADLLWGGK